MTPAEKRLWTALQNKQLDGLRFRPQHPVGRFILDFYCPACKLVLEIDGDIHDLQPERDQERTEHLTAYGYHVLRFRNETIFDDLPAVLETIRKTAHEISFPDPGTNKSSQPDE